MSVATAWGFTGSVRYTATSTLPVAAAIIRFTCREMSSARPNSNSAMNVVETAANATNPLRRSPWVTSRSM